MNGVLVLLLAAVGLIVGLAAATLMLLAAINAAIAVIT